MFLKANQDGNHFARSVMNLELKNLTHQKNKKNFPE